MALSKEEYRDIEYGRHDRPILLEGMKHPPFVLPYCRLCGNPVQRLRYNRVTSIYHLEVEAECCGKQQGRRVSIEEIRRIKATNDKLWLIVGRGQEQTVERYGGRIIVGGKTYRVSGGPKWKRRGVK